MIFVVWHNYNGYEVERFKDIESAERRCADILHAEEKDSYGTRIDLIVNGTEFKTTVIKRVKEIELEEIVE